MLASKTIRLGRASGSFTTALACLVEAMLVKAQSASGSSSGKSARKILESSVNELCRPDRERGKSTRTQPNATAYLQGIRSIWAIGYTYS